MAPASTIVKRMPMASSLLRRRSQCQILSSTSAGFARRTIHSHSRLALLSSSSHPFSSRESPYPTQQYQIKSIGHFSSLAQDWDGEDDADGEISKGGGGDGVGGGHHPPKPKQTGLLPTRHSRNLPPPVCPPSALRSEVEAIFDAPIGSLIVYDSQKSESGTGLGAAAMGELKSVEEEMTDAYYASDAIVQRAEYIMRGLNARVSGESFVGRSLRRGTMTYEEEEEDGSAGGGEGEVMSREECFRAMLDLMERMKKEGESYDELRTRIRSQLVDPSSPAGAGEDSGSSSDSSSSDDSDSDSDDEGAEDEKADDVFNEWTQSMEQSMRKAKISTKPNDEGINAFASSKNEDEEAVASVKLSEEQYQFGADPGVTVHMYDLVLDSLACLCHERYGDAVADSAIDLAEVMPEGNPSPPELAKEMLDMVLHRHWMDGGDIGLGGGGSETNPFGGVGQGIGIGAGTGAGALVNTISPNANFDVRTCPTPMTFNAVLRIAANFDPSAHAEAVENAKVLGGNMGLAAFPGGGGGAPDLKQEQERLRDVTIDAALTTFARMQYCVALTLRSLRNSTKNATSRSALKRQAKMLAGNYKPKEQNNFISGRNSATYSYLIQTVANCIPPSLSRGNMTFGLYHKGCVQEGIMDERLVKVMRGVGGYENGDGEDALEDAVEKVAGDVPPPPVSNGPIFDHFMTKELGGGVDAALEKGRKLRQDRNYKLRRHVEWDDIY